MKKPKPEIIRQQNQFNIFIISGPSGVGKDTILNLMKKKYLSYHYVITVTTRKKRQNEIDGTEGSWSLQEGEDDLFVINRKTGKKFKIKLEAV